MTDVHNLTRFDKVCTLEYVTLALSAVGPSMARRSEDMMMLAKMKDSQYGFRAHAAQNYREGARE